MVVERDGTGGTPGTSGGRAESVDPVEWILRIGVFGCFVGHGVFGLLRKPAWLDYFAALGFDPALAQTLMPVVGSVDIAIGVVSLFRPITAVLAWATFWGLFTAFLRPLAGEPFWEVLERGGNFGVPLALLLFTLGRAPGIAASAWQRSRLPAVGAVLQWATVLLLLGHGALAAAGKDLFAGHLAVLGIGPAAAPALGAVDVALALWIAVRPAPAILVAVCVWKLATEALFPLSGAPIWEFVERAGSYAAPLALAWLMADARLKAPSGWRVRQPVVAGLVAAILLAATSASLVAQSSSRWQAVTRDTPEPTALADLVDRLRDGGLTLVCRHAITDHSQRDRGEAREEQRNLSGEGRAQARALGAAFRSLGVQFGTVLASPMFRTMDSAELAFGRVTEEPRLRGARARAELPALLRQRPERRSNRIMMSHQGTIRGAIPIGRAPLEEGDCLVLSHSGRDSFEVEARVGAAQWSTVGRERSEFTGSFGDAVGAGSDAGGVRASEAPTATLKRLTGPVDIDGRLEEADWQGSPAVESLVQRQPDPGEPATETTLVYLAYDDEALYVAARLDDSKPTEIVGRLARRDQISQSDRFEVYLDSYGDRRTGFGFIVNAAGVQRDLRITNDDNMDASWDAVWESAVAKTAQGWTVELKIPLSQLRYAPADERDQWGLNVARFISRRNEMDYWAPIEDGVRRFVSRFGHLDGVSALPAARGVELLPYTTAQWVRAPITGNSSLADPAAVAGRVGGDLRVGLPGGFSLSATFNPDFGQVEADPSTVNLTAFETFLSERRPFFVEGADAFRSPVSFGPDLFYSRRIGRRPQGRLPSDVVDADVPSATTILGAAKLTGRTSSGWSFGALQAVTQGESAATLNEGGALGSAPVEPAASYSVARASRTMRGGRTVLGATATQTWRNLAGESAFGQLHSSAHVVQFDGIHRFWDDGYEAGFAFTGSHVRGSTSAITATQRAAGRYFQRPDAEHLAVDSTRTSLTGSKVGVRVAKTTGNVRAQLVGIATSPEYEVNDLGIHFGVDRLWMFGMLAYQDFTPGRIFRNWRVELIQGHARTYGGEVMNHFSEIGSQVQFANYWSGGFWIQRQPRIWNVGGLRGGPALRRDARIDGAGWLNTDRRKALSARVFTYLGQERNEEGWNGRIDGTLTYRPSDGLSVSMGPSLDRSRTPAQYLQRFDGPSALGTQTYLFGDLESTTVAMNSRVNYTVSPTLSFELWARPFVAAGEYGAIHEARTPGADRFEDRFRSYSPSEIEGFGDEDAPGYRLDRDADGTFETQLSRPDFNVRSLQVNAVLRWEYRPGSALFVVWAHDRSGFGSSPFDLGGDLRALGSLPGRNVFQVKATYWFGL